MVMKILDAQVRAVELRRADEATARKREIEELRQLWDKMAQEQEEQDVAERERMKRLAAELFEFNRIKQMEISERERRERWVRVVGLWSRWLGWVQGGWFGCHGEGRVGWGRGKVFWFGEGRGERGWAGVGHRLMWRWHRGVREHEFTCHEGVTMGPPMGKQAGIHA